MNFFWPVKTTTECTRSGNLAPSSATRIFQLSSELGMAANFAANFATEEAFVHATVCDFVKLWGNGSQAHLRDKRDSQKSLGLDNFCLVSLGLGLDNPPNAQSRGVSVSTT